MIGPQATIFGSQLLTVGDCIAQRKYLLWRLRPCCESREPHWQCPSLDHGLHRGSENALSHSPVDYKLAGAIDHHHQIQCLASHNKDMTFLAEDTTLPLSAERSRSRYRLRKFDRWHRQVVIPGLWTCHFSLPRCKP